MFVRKLIGIYHPDTKFPYQLSSKLRLKYMTYYVTKLLTARYFNYKPWPDLKFKSYACDNAQLPNYEPDIHVSVHHTQYTKMTNKMQMCRIIYYSLVDLHVSSDIFARHQEHLNCITVSGTTHVCCCRLVSWECWNASSNTPMIPSFSDIRV